MLWINCIPPNSSVETLSPHGTAFKAMAFKEVIKVKSGHKGRTLI